MDVAVLDIASGSVRPAVVSPANEGSGRLAPNQRWVAYASDSASAGD
jgi:hypothetical protein